MEYKENNLDLKPELLEGEFVFHSLVDASYGEFKEMNPIASIQEREGLTLVIPKEIADRQNIPYASSYRCISLGLTSDLDD